MAVGHSEREHLYIFHPNHTLAYSSQKCSTLLSSTHHDRSGIHEIQVQERDEGHPSVLLAEAGEVLLASGHGDAGGLSSLEEVLVPGLSPGNGAAFAKVSRLVAAVGDPGDEGHKEDAPEDGGPHSTDHEDDHCEQREGKGRAIRDRRGCMMI